VKFTLPVYRSTGLKTVTVKYLGSSLTRRVTEQVNIRVVR
jgi:hypothetical protein